MDGLSFEDLDNYLLRNRDKIIHQIWFGIIPDKKTAKKTFEKMKKYRDSWIINNSNWCYFCWNYINCRLLVKKFYPQHLEMYDQYPWLIQKCDAVRYFILHRYGGLYADMDYYCNRPWSEVLDNYPEDLYLVETPNSMNKDSVHISNALMYSKSGHVFWNKLFIEMELNRIHPIYYSRHIAIMFTTGPGILNRTFNKYMNKFNLNYYPYKLFHPHGLMTDIKTLNVGSEVYAVHLGKGSWENKDSKLIIFMYQEHKILLFIVGILLVQYFIGKYVN